MKSGDVIGGKYRLTERLGAGGMGAVWEAINERTGRKVALKLILHPTEDLRERLRREGRACGSLRHRNIVEVYDVDVTSAGDPFLVMQLLTGQTLGDLLASRRRLDPSLVARIGRDIASALAAAHEKKIIHRDLKPANIFLHREEDGGEVDEDGFVVKVVDFGVAKMLSADGAGVVTSALVGSPAYMSPEQLCVSKGLDHRTDIWSLGVVLYEMLTGKRPFVGSIEDVITQILTAPIPQPSHHVRQLPRAFDEIVARCLERDRGKRIGSAADLARLLDALKDECVGVRAPSSASFNGARLAQGSAPGASPIPGMGRPVQPSVPVGADASDLAATLLYKKNGAQAEAGADGGGKASPTETRILSPDEPIASPMPEWRRAVEARRQGTPMNAAATPEVQQGGTMAILPEEVAKMAASMPGTSVTTTTVPLVQKASAGAAPEEPAEGKQPTRRRHGRFFVHIGVGVAVVVALAGFVATRFVSAAPEGAGPEVAKDMEAQPPAPVQMEVPKQVVAPVQRPPEAPAPPTTAPAPKAPQKAPSGGTKSSSASVPAPAPLATNKGTTSKPQLPKCTFLNKKNCRPAYAPKGM